MNLNMNQDDISWTQALLRGWMRRCPRCGEGKVLKGYLQPASSCSVCNLDLTSLKSEDGPAYITMCIVCFVVIPLLYWVEVIYEPPLLLILGGSLLVTLVSLLLLLPLVKGAFIAAAWKAKTNAQQ